MTRWMHGPELESARDRAPFDPVAEGTRYRLPAEVSLAIWGRVCGDATDAPGRRDLAQAQQRFHDLAARIAARGGRLHPDVGKLTRVGAVSDGGLYQAYTDELAIPTPGRQTLVSAEAHRGSAPHAAIRTPGRQTLVTAEAHRWPAAHETPAITADDTAPAPSPNELPGAAEVARIMAALQSPPRTAPAPSDRPARPPTSPQIASEPDDGSPPSGDRRPRDHALPPATLDRMQRAFGRRFDDVEIHADSAEVPAGQQAFTRGNHIYLERGAVDLGKDGDHDRHGHREPQGRDVHNEHRDHVLAHELAHVVQQSRAAEHGTDRPPTRAALEADAHQAALSVLAGRAATVHLFAPSAAALGFSRGEPRPPASQPQSAAPAAHARAPSSAPGHAPASHSSGSAPASRPTLRTTAFDRPAAMHRPAASASPAAVPVASSRRGGGGDGLLLPEAPSALSPAAAGRLQNIRAANQVVAGAVTNLPTAEHQTDVARGAVVEPQAEQDAHAQHGVVAAVDDRPPPSPEIEAACARIRQVIRDKRPPDEDKLVDAKPREMAQEAGEQMSAGVEERAGTVRQGYADMQQNPQGTPSRTPVPATLPPERAQAPPVDANAGAPDPLKHDDVSLDGDVAAQQQKIQDAGMNTEAGQLVKDGPIGDARGGVGDLQTMAKTDPQKVLADQAAAIAHAKGDMQALQASAEKMLAAARAGTVAQMATHTTGVKGSEEQQRAEAGAKMQAIFAATQKNVDTLLQPLSKNAVDRWEAGVKQLSTDFEASLADVKKKIDDRHSGAFGGAVSLWDDWTGLPGWVTEDYDRAEAKFGDGATALITDISRDVNQVIDDCKKLIDQARKDIEAIVKSLPASLQTWAQGEADKLGKQLDQLSQKVDQTQHGLNQDLINRANGAVQTVRERVADLREQAKGLLGKIADAIAEFIKDPAKAIVNGLLRILGIPPASFWSLIDRLGDVIGAIAQDPVKFGKTLISGAAQGFQQFFEHFPQHLREILMSWLFGTLGTAGVPMPTDFSGPGIMVTVLGIVGIDTSMISSMLGADVSDPAEMAEVKQELAGVLSGDPHALVNLLRDHFDPASLIPMIKEAAMSFLIQALITQVAPRIAAMLVPGGAILQAIEAIFKVLMWVVNNAARIFTLIESLVATAGQAVASNVSGVAAGVESGLVQIIVLVIDFLAGYIGLGSLGAKLKGVIMKVSGKLKGVLKKVLDAIKKRAKAKAKHDHHKPAADKKPEGDRSAAAQHPKQDDRDPQKAKDDAKDPRNHKPDADAKDPRNHKPHDDDKDPRNHKPDADDKDPRTHKPHDDAAADPKRHKPHEDHDPKKHKDDEDRDPKKHKDDDDDPKKKKENDQAEARRAARAAASRGWAVARTATEREVQSKTELKHVLSREAHSTPKIKIDLEPRDEGKAWTVEAHAKVDAARATDTEGHGWISRDESSRAWYAARDLSQFNLKLIEEAFNKLTASGPPSKQNDPQDDDRARYEHKKWTGTQAVEEMQRQLDGQIRGLKAAIQMEPWSSVEKDRRILTEISVTPNRSEKQKQVSLGELSDIEFQPIVRVATMHRSGKHSVAIEPADNGSLQLLIDNSPAEVQVLKVMQGPVAYATNQTGYEIAFETHQKIESLQKGLQVIKVTQNKINADEYTLAKTYSRKATEAVEGLGQKMRSTSLLHASKIRDAEPVTITFTTYAGPAKQSVTDTAKDTYSKEMTRQLKQQQDGLNKLLIDQWIINREKFNPSERLNELDSNTKKEVLADLHRRAIKAQADIAQWQNEQKALRQELSDLNRLPATTPAQLRKVQRRLDEVTKQLNEEAPKLNEYKTAEEHALAGKQDEEYDLAQLRVVGGRTGEEEKFKEETTRAKRRILTLIRKNDSRFDGWNEVVNQLSDLAALHDPDQIAGGYGVIGRTLEPPPRGRTKKEWLDYIDKMKHHYGIGKVNSSIGSQWGPKQKSDGKAKELYDKVVDAKTNPQAVYGLNKLNVRLKHKAEKG